MLIVHETGKIYYVTAIYSVLQQVFVWLSHQQWLENTVVQPIASLTADEPWATMHSLEGIRAQFMISTVKR